MSIYIDENTKVKNMFVNVNGEKKSVSSAWVNRNGLPTKVFQLNNEKENDLYEVAYKNEYSNWNYTLDEGNKIITLNYCQNYANADVIVYANYNINGVTYKTQLKNSTYSSNNASYPSNYMFANRDNIKTIKFSDSLDTSNLTNMNHMFHACSGVTSIDFGNNFDTSNVTEMAYTFSNCNALTNLNLSSFDTSNVTTMKYMFGQCYVMTNIDLSNFETRKVTNMWYMFGQCRALTNLDLSSFNTSNATDMGSMFEECYNLVNIYVTEEMWITKQADISKMFRSCGTSSVTYI